MIDITKNRKRLLEYASLRFEPHDTNVKVVDSIMGSGKTSAIINEIKQYEDTARYIFVTPYLDQIKRILESTRTFKAPQSLGDGKLESLHQLLAQGKNIACTHALFLYATEETKLLISRSEYTLILDETLDILQEYNSVVGLNHRQSKANIKQLIHDGYMSIDEKYNVIWNSNAQVYEQDWFGDKVKHFAEIGNLKCISDVLYLEFPPEVFRAFEHIIVLTYLFPGSMLYVYFNAYGFKINYSSADYINGKYQIVEYQDDSSQRKRYASLISICNNRNYTEKIPCRTKNGFSKSWFAAQDKATFDAIKKCMRNYKTSLKASSERVMWTAFQQFRGKVEPRGFKYTKSLTPEEKSDESKRRKYSQFVSCNARATNDYADRDVLIYLVNRFPSPELNKFYAARGYTINQDKFALGEMLQWIWRSAIRNDQHIDILIFSKRMRELLQLWLDGEDDAL